MGLWKLFFPYHSTVSMVWIGFPFVFFHALCLFEKHKKLCHFLRDWHLMVTVTSIMLTNSSSVQKFYFLIAVISVMGTGGHWSKIWKGFLALAGVKYRMTLHLLSVYEITVLLEIFSFGFLENSEKVWPDTSRDTCVGEGISVLQLCIPVAWSSDSHDTRTYNMLAPVETLLTPCLWAFQWVTFPGGRDVPGLPRPEVWGQTWDNAVTTALHADQWTLGTPGSGAPWQLSCPRPMWLYSLLIRIF